jgi:hypothetical protein
VVVFFPVWEHGPGGLSALQFVATVANHEDNEVPAKDLAVLAHGTRDERHMLLHESYGWWPMNIPLRDAIDSVGRVLV